MEMAMGVVVVKPANTAAARVLHVHNKSAPTSTRYWQLNRMKRSARRYRWMIMSFLSEPCFTSMPRPVIEEYT